MPPADAPRAHPVLVLLNGPPGCGKSTLATRYAADHPLTLALDIDRVRAMLGGWRRHPTEAGLAARELALVAARTHLRAGHDVVVPQLLARPDFLVRLERLAAEVGAPFVEIVLLDTREAARRRFVDRTARAETRDHVEAAAALDAAGGLDELDAMYDRLVAMLADRPAAHRVPSVEGDVDGTYAAVLAVVRDAVAEAARRDRLT